MLALLYHSVDRDVVLLRYSVWQWPLAGRRGVQRWEKFICWSSGYTRHWPDFKVNIEALRTNLPAGVARRILLEVMTLVRLSGALAIDDPTSKASRRMYLEITATDRTAAQPTCGNAECTTACIHYSQSNLETTCRITMNGSLLMRIVCLCFMAFSCELVCNRGSHRREGAACNIITRDKPTITTKWNAWKILFRRT